MVIKKKKSYLWSKCIEKICLFSHLVHHVKILFDFETLIKKKCCMYKRFLDIGQC